MGFIETFALFAEFLARLGALSYLSESCPLLNNKSLLFGLGREREGVSLGEDIYLYSTRLRGLYSNPYPK